MAGKEMESGIGVVVQVKPMRPRPVRPTGVLRIGKTISGAEEEAVVVLGDMVMVGEV